MNTPARIALELLGHCTRKAYVRRERRLAAAQKPQSILLSARADWAAPIRQGFDGLAHALTFANLAAADLDAFDMIVPLTLDDARWLRKQSAFTRARVAPMPDEACVALCQHKPYLAEMLIVSGFSAHLPAMGEHVQPPFVFKPVRGDHSAPALLVPDRASAAQMGDALVRPGFFRQHAVAGSTAYVSHFLMREGRLERELTLRRHHDTPLFIEGASAIERVALCPDRDTLAAMLRTIGYDGMGCAHYKMDADVLKLLDIQPRIGASLGAYLFSFVRSMQPQSRSRRSAFMPWSWIDTASDDAPLSAY